MDGWLFRYVFVCLLMGGRGVKEDGHLVGCWGVCLFVCLFVGLLMGSSTETGKRTVTCLWLVVKVFRCLFVC